MRVSFEGRCTIERAAELHGVLMRALGSGDALDLDFHAVKEMDMSFCQLIHSVRTSCREQGLVCTLTPNLAPELTVPATRCGLPELGGQSSAPAVGGCAEGTR